jgi:hypothetical protein
MGKSGKKGKGAEGAFLMAKKPKCFDCSFLIVEQGYRFPVYHCEYYKKLIYKMRYLRERANGCNKFVPKKWLKGEGDGAES